MRRRRRKPIIRGYGRVRQKKRLAECGANNSCSPEGNVFVEYIDSLAQSVKDRKMTEAEPMRRYAEYKSGGESRCTQVGNATKCY